MSTTIIFDFIKAAKFFPEYAPGVKNWKHKLRGRDGNKKPITFTKEDQAMIHSGVGDLFNDLAKKRATK